MLIDVTSEAGNFISNVRAPISKLHLGFLWKTPIDTISLVQPLNSTLRTLALEGVEIRDEGLQLSNVRSLSIRVPGSPDPEPLNSAFPNLRELFLVPTDAEYEWGEGEVEEHRTKNRAALGQMSTRWAYLDSLSGPALSVFAMNLPCRVRYLELLRVEAESPDIVYTILGTLQPSVLKLSVTTESATLEDIETFLALVLNHIGNVTQLDLEIDLSYSMVDGTRIMVSSAPL